MSRRAILSTLTLLLLAAAPTPAAAAPEATFDMQDPADDILVRPEDGGDHVGSRPAIDLTRFRQGLDGDVLVIELDFAGDVGEPGMSLEVLLNAGRSIGEGASFAVRWDGEGSPPATASTFHTAGGTVGQANMTLAVEGQTLLLRIDGLPIADLECVGPSIITTGVRAADGEYTDYYAPHPLPCAEDARFDGARGACDAVAAPDEDPLAVTIDDAEEDVVAVDAFGRESGDASDHGMYDIVAFESAREGDRIVQTVTLGEPRTPHDEIKVEVINRLSGGQDRDQDPEHAVVVQYWRFANASQSDRVEGTLLSPDGTEAPFYVELESEGAALTLSWCASLLPEDPACIGIEVEATRVNFLAGGVRDDARAAVDPCLGAASAEGETPPPADDEPVDEGEEPVDGEEDAGEQNESPGFGLLAGLVAVGLALALVPRSRAR